jgi:uncharacterized protein YjaZ
MQVVVHDTLALLEPLFTSRACPRALLREGLAALQGPGGLFDLMRPVLEERERGGDAVMAAVQQDGHEALMAQQAWGLFNPSRSRELSDWQFARCREADVPALVAACLGRCSTVLPAPPSLARIECFLLPGDPANRAFMVDARGLSCFGGVPGFVVVQLWPSDGNLARLPAALARVYAHNLRWAQTRSDGPPTLGDFLALEGLAAAAVAAVVPESLPEPWLAAFRPAEDWEAALRWVAARYGVERYDDVVVNVYGARAPVGPARPPWPAPLDAEELAYARAVIAEAPNTTDERLIAARLYSDHFVAAQGHPAVGLPPYAGFAVACRLAREYLDRTGRDPAQAMPAPTRAILAGG